MKLTNYLELDNAVGCGSRPETDDDFAFLATKYVNILNLERGWFEFFHGITNRETIMTIQNSMLPFRVEMSDFTPPTFHELDACLSVLNLGHTYFHCKWGKDRTGMVRAAYRVRMQNWTVDEAINEMLQMGMHLVYRPFWIPHLREYLKPH